MQSSPDFAGQTVLVTGAATGLGFAIAREFGLAGARIALNDLSPESLEEPCEQLANLDIECRTFAGDVRNSAAVTGMVEDILSQFGAIDILVANAGLYPVSGFLDMSEDEWDRVIDTNLKGAFLTCQAAARAMVSAGHGGQIITMSSGAANRAILGWSHYCTSKAGVVMLTRSMALELAPLGIRVNAILPGYIDVDEGGEHLDPAYKETARNSIPLGRPGTPADIANAVLLLASPLAAYVTGATLTVDGGGSAGNPTIRPA